jgi:hypothetical protein
MEQTKSKKIVMASTCAIAAAGFAVVSLAIPFTAQHELTATGTERSISYAYGVNQTTMGTQVETTTGITNAGTGTRVVTKTSYFSANGGDYSYTKNPFYCVSSVAESASRAQTQLGVTIDASIMNITSITTTYAIAGSTSCDVTYRPYAVFYSGENITGTASPKSLFSSDEASAYNAQDYTNTITVSDLNLGFTPRSVRLAYSYYAENGEAATVEVLSVSISWTC